MGYTVTGHNFQENVNGLCCLTQRNWEMRSKRSLWFITVTFPEAKACKNLNVEAERYV